MVLCRCGRGDGRTEEVWHPQLLGPHRGTPEALPRLSNRGLLHRGAEEEHGGVLLPRIGLCYAERLGILLAHEC